MKVLKDKISHAEKNCLGGHRLSLPEMRDILAHFGALAAEGAAMRDAINQTIGWQESTDPENTESVRLLVALKTPATEAALAEIKAQGAYMVIDRLYHTTEEQVSRDVYQDALLIVANLRAGRKG